MATGATIAEARKAAGLTQAELALRVGTSQSAINRYEHDRVMPRQRTLHRLLDACRRPLRPSEVLTARRDEVLAFAREHGASYVMVFGSVARGEDDYASDLDLLMDIPTTYGLFGLTRLQLELSELLDEVLTTAASGRPGAASRPHGCYVPVKRDYREHRRRTLGSSRLPDPRARPLTGQAYPGP